jgi:hypothetical protein
VSSPELLLVELDSAEDDGATGWLLGPAALVLGASSDVAALSGVRVGADRVGGVRVGDAVLLGRSIAPLLPAPPQEGRSNITTTPSMTIR